MNPRLEGRGQVAVGPHDAVKGNDWIRHDNKRSRERCIRLAFRHENEAGTGAPQSLEIPRVPEKTDATLIRLLERREIRKNGGGIAAEKSSFDQARDFGHRGIHPRMRPMPAGAAAPERALNQFVPEVPAAGFAEVVEPAGAPALSAETTSSVRSLTLLEV